MEIVQQLVEKLGVNKDQAEGGLGMLLKFVKEKLGDNFGSVAKEIPEADQLIDDAPSGEPGSGGLMGAVSGLASGLGGKIGGISNLTGLVEGFKSLGLSADMIQKFGSTAMSFLKSKGADSAANSISGLME